MSWSPILTSDRKNIRLLAINGPKNLSMVDSVNNNADFWESLPFEENEKLFESVKDEL